MKNTRKILACLLAVIMVLSCFALMPVGATEAASVSADASIYDPNASVTLSDAVDGVVYIDSANEFMAFANKLNSGDSFSGKTIKLNCDIVINQGDVSTWTNPISWNGFGGSWGNRFAGNIDGQGHTISGIYNKHTESAGMFGRTAGGNEFKNFNLVNSYFEATGTGSNSVKAAGAIIGLLDPNWGATTTTISNVHVDATVVGGSGVHGVGGFIGRTANPDSVTVIVENSSFTGTVNASKIENVGGIGGYLRAENVIVKNTAVDATVTGGNMVGGLIGQLNYCNTVISNCSIEGTVKADAANGSNKYHIGTIVGWTKVTANMTLAVSEVLAAAKCEPKCEALITTVYGEDANLTIKFVLSDIIYDSTVQAISCYVMRDNQNKATSKVNNYDKTYASANWELNGTNGGGQIPNAQFNVTARSSAELKGSKVFDFWTAVENGYPTVPATAIPDSYSGVASDAYATSGNDIIIYTAEQFMGFANTLNGGNNFSGKTIKLATDIVINKGDVSTWTSPYNWNGYGGSWTNRFAGSFDGQGHTISGIYNKHDIAAGMFGRYAGGTEFKNVSIVNSYFESTGASGDTGVGAIFGLIDPNWGAVTTTISNVYVDATIVGSSSNVYASAGFVGRVKNHDPASIVFENCTFNGTVNAPAAGKVGGFVGHFSGNNLSFTNCSVDADLTAYSNMGGLVGRVLLGTNVTISNCLVVSDINAGAADTTAGVIGYYSTEYGAGAASISNTLVSVRGENVLAAVLGHWGKDSKKLTVTLDNVKYDANRFNGNKMRDIYTSAGDLLIRNYDVNTDITGMKTTDLNGNAIFDGWTAVVGSYPVPASKSVNELKASAYENYGKTTEILGYQTAENSDGTYAARVIATLTNELTQNYVAAGFKDIKVTLVNGAVLEVPVYYCQYAYRSVIGGGYTYAAGEYLADSFFCLTIDNAPAEIASIEATPFVMMGEDEEPVFGQTKTWGVSVVDESELITVVSANVYLHDDVDPDGTGPKTADDRINALKAQLLAQDPDVICVQEDNWTAKLDSLLVSSGYTAVRGKAISRSGWTGLTYESYEYQTIYFKTAKFDLVASGQKWLSDTPDVQFSEFEGYDDVRPRGINYAELKVKGSDQTIFVFNVHLENNSPARRLQETAKLVELVGAIAGETPAVVCGDFNLISNSSDSSDKSALQTLKTTYDDSRIVADFTETHATFINAEGKIFGVEGATATSTSGTIIDYCFTTKGDFYVYSYDVIAEKQDGIYTSDHLPLVIKLAINSAE